MTYQKQTYLITGGAGGIGRYLVTKLIHLGHDVIFIDRDEEKGLTLMGELSNHHLQFMHYDLKDPLHLEAIALAIKSMDVRIDTIIHNACISKGGINDASYDDFIDVIKVGLAAPFYLTKLLLPYVSEKANVIHIASTRAFQSQANTECYSAAKGGLIALTHALSVSLSGKVRVNSISPGWIDTTSDQKATDAQDDLQHPSKRRGISKDILKAVIYLSDLDNDFVNGENIIIDGGMSKQMIYHNDFGWKKA